MVTGNRPMTPLLNRDPLESIGARNIKFFLSIRKEVIESDNSLLVISLSQVGENEFFQTL